MIGFASVGGAVWDTRAIAVYIYTYQTSRPRDLTGRGAMTEIGVLVGAMHNVTAPESQ